MYELVYAFFGLRVTSTENKDKPGVRNFLQVAGQWGRNEVSEQYPLTPERGLFCSKIREYADTMPRDFGVEWLSFGLDPDLWLNACLKRVDEYLEKSPTARVAVTNCRFPNEFNALRKAGWEHYHVMCSPGTWAARLTKRGLKPESPVLKDVSEKLAHSLDANVTKQISTARNGHKLHCVWNDPGVVPPSARLLTDKEFLGLFV